VKASDVASETAEAQEGDDLFEMAGVFPHRPVGRGKSIRSTSANT
jgi:hypothetical protein